MDKFCRRISRQNKNACASRKRSSSTERRNFGSLQRRRRPASVNGGVWNAARAVVAASGPRHTVAGLGEDGQLLSGTSGVMGRNEPITLVSNLGPAVRLYSRSFFRSGSRSRQGEEDRSKSRDRRKERHRDVDDGGRREFLDGEPLKEGSRERRRSRSRRRGDRSRERTGPKLVDY
jgi:hypothetical protein